MPGFHAYRRLADNWVNIVLTIVSIIQGFVFSVLLMQFPHAFKYSKESQNFVVLMLFILCFFVSLRVFQMYITAIIDAEFRVPDLFELFRFFLAFVVGSIEYYIFSLFEALEHGLAITEFLSRFYKWGIGITLVGAIAHPMVLWHFRRQVRERCRSEGSPLEQVEEYRRERSIQLWNTAGMLGMMAIQVLLLILSTNGGSNPTLIGNVQIPLVCGIIVILVANMHHSIKLTFLENGPTSDLPTQASAPKVETIEVDVSAAEEQDVADIRNMLMQNFGYIYSTLFGTNEKQTSAILESILRANRGNHPLGYRSFYIAHPKFGKKEIVGILKLADSASRFRTFICGVAIARVVFLKLGFRGLLNTWVMWRAIRGISPKVGSKELHIVYLAVRDDARNMGVGTQLLERAKEIAKRAGKESISLCVREKNGYAKSFFRERGFHELKSSNNKKADDLLEHGKSIRMTSRL